MNFQIVKKPYPHDGRTIAVLKSCADFVVLDGLNYLIPKWKEYTELFVEGYNFEDNIYDFLNDLDTRHLIEKTIKVLTSKERDKINEELKYYDNKFIHGTFELKECAWGINNENNNNYNRKDNWYYYRAPQNLIDSETELEKKE